MLAVPFLHTTLAAFSSKCQPQLQHHDDMLAVNTSNHASGGREGHEEESTCPRGFRVGAAPGKSTALGCLRERGRPPSVVLGALAHGPYGESPLTASKPTAPTHAATQARRRFLPAHEETTYKAL